MDRFYLFHSCNIHQQCIKAIKICDDINTGHKSLLQSTYKTGTWVQNFTIIKLNSFKCIILSKLNLY